MNEETYILTLNSVYFDYMLNGTRRIEMRLYSDKKRYMKVGDKIRFFKLPDNNEYFDAKIVELIKCKSFADIIDNYDIKYLVDKDYKVEDLIKSLRGMYTKDEETKYGVIGIKVELLSDLQKIK